MAEWLYEEGISENRAILIEEGEIIEARIELPAALRAGAVVPAQLTKVLTARRGIARLEDGQDLFVEPIPTGLTEGSPLHVEIVREALPEAGRPKPARARPTDQPLRPGLALAEQIGRSAPGLPRRGDPFEEAGWSDLLEQARTGQIPFAGGALRLSLTPAMTLFDVDGLLPPAELALRGAEAAARAIRRLDIGGSIGLDLPTVEGKAARQEAAAAIDAWLPLPFERTAVNGFGFLQIVRRRSRPSLPEIIQSDPVGAAARALLRQAEHAAGDGFLTIAAAPLVTDLIQSRPDWLATLERRIGAAVILQPAPHLSISAGHAQRRHQA